ncbi:CDP-diacylglycerol pyrophosphatase [Paraburkholderia caffeinitolerans]|uniref:CDP-diacylglycerol pyrophosphatase n=1 Tax=Paraburkholderia caffeinitolerans TaxID=1723730 RepID=A0A6J5GHZ0_9BURK|nr:CDP-diacylglycerol diphosphatase [Paraburkholderia caffeinitolerans]CAB3798305.1 CDP-diacylglycerol pyrophosphatase [Paraburkholderia caffeinitolerans]
MPHVSFAVASARAARFASLAAALAAVLFATSCARLSTLDSSGLWKVVGEQCVPNARDKGDPGPCTSVDFQKRYAVLKDINGRAQYLLIPTDRVTGIETPEILYGGSPEYWVGAWSAGRYVDARLKATLAPTQLGLEINSSQRRSQNQLHIHVDCMRNDIADALAPYRHDAPGTWRWTTLDGKRYRVTRVMSLADQGNPFRVVERDLGPKQSMAVQTILVTGAGADTARDGWLVVNSGLDVEGGTGTAEGLLDHSCALARAQ